MDRFMVRLPKVPVVLAGAQAADETIPRNPTEPLKQRVVRVAPQCERRRGAGRCGREASPADRRTAPAVRKMKTGLL